MQKLLKSALLGAALVGVAACSDRLTVPNYQNATPESIQGDPASAVPLLASGILRNDRDNATTYVLGVGILGREAYNYTPTEGRNTTGYLSAEANTSSSFVATSGALWASQYTLQRNVVNLIGTLNGAAPGVFTDARKSAGLGFAHTMSGLSLSYVIASRWNLGAPVDIKADPAIIAPFVSRDSVYRYIVSQLDLGATELAAGGTAFPFTLHAGYAGFNTPANYRKFNRALAARINAYRASIGASGCGAARSAACYTTVLTNLSESFIDTLSLAIGPFNVYSSAASDVSNGISNQSNTSVVAHAKADSGIQNKLDATKDNRYLTKVISITTKRPANPTHGVGTDFDYSVYAVRESSVPIIRKEELFLLRAEARYFTGDLAGALADINVVRVKAGGLAPLTAFASEAAFLDELLYNRRLSLVFEGHRWVDMRRFGRLNQLTLDLPTHIILTQVPVPQNECLSRARETEPALKGPGC